MVSGYESKSIEGFAPITTRANININNNSTNNTDEDLSNESENIPSTTFGNRKKQDENKLNSTKANPITTKGKITPTKANPITTKGNPITTKGKITPTKANPITTKGKPITKSKPITKGKPTSEESNSPFKNIKNKFEDVDDVDAVNNVTENNGKYDDEDEDEDDDEQFSQSIHINDKYETYDEGYEEDDEKEFKNHAYKKPKNYEDYEDNEDSIEGFRGSQIIEGRNLKNVLLALLISFIGYIVAMSSIKNYIPIVEYAPHMKKFKHLIYVGIFFMITYICLEVF